jgi:predicted lipoprotein with Yx(FWY)xxD motif
MRKPWLARIARSAYAMRSLVLALIFAVGAFGFALPWQQASGDRQEAIHLIAAKDIVKITCDDAQFKTCALACRRQYGDLCAIATEPCSKDYYRCFNECRVKYLSPC